MDFPDLNPEFHRDLFRVTGRMRRLKTNPRAITLHEYKNMLGDVCGAITHSLEHGLRDAVEYAADLKNDPDVLAEAQEIVRNFGNFVRFTEFEGEALRSIGVDGEVVSDMTQILSDIRPMIDLRSYDAKDIVREIEGFKATICEAAEQAERYINSESQQTEDRKRALLTYGIALTVANATGVALTLGQATPLLFVSSAAGGVMITKRSAIEDRFDRPPK